MLRKKDDNLQDVRWDSRVVFESAVDFFFSGIQDN